MQETICGRAPMRHARCFLRGMRLSYVTFRGPQCDPVIHINRTTIVDRVASDTQ